MPASHYQTQCNGPAVAPAGGHSPSAASIGQTPAVSHDMLLDSIKDLLTRHQQSLLEEVGQVISSSINDLKDEVQESSCKGLDAALETQQDVSSLSAEISSLRQAQLALRQQLNHNQSMYDLQIKTLKDVFREEIREAREESKSAHKYARCLRAEIQLLRQQIDCPPRFPQFSKLPPEIRHMIWDFALPRNLLPVHQTDILDNGEVWTGWIYEKKQPPPAVAQACREGRTIACYTGAMVPIDNTRRFIRDGTFENDDTESDEDYDEVQLGETVWSWFDPTRDSLLLKLSASLSPLEEEDFHRGITKLTTGAKHVTLELTDNQRIRACVEHMLNPKHFGSLERVDLVAQYCDLKGRTDPTLETLLFGSNKTCVTIDLDMSEDFFRKLRAHHTSPLIDELEDKLESGSMACWLNPTDASKGIKRWSKFVKGVKQSYLEIQHYWSPLGGVEGPLFKGERKVGASPEWIKALRHRMPSFHRVAMVTLEEV